MLTQISPCLDTQTGKEHRGESRNREREKRDKTGQMVAKLSMMQPCLGSGTREATLSSSTQPHQETEARSGQTMATTPSKLLCLRSGTGTEVGWVVSLTRSGTGADWVVVSTCPLARAAEVAALTLSEQDEVEVSTCD